MQREELNRYLDGLLEVSRYRDYCPNGLQVEGRGEIRRIVSGVTASLDLIQAALAEDADAVLVHHGYFWKGDDPCLTGTRRARIGLLIAHELNLFAYHLPLDAHAELGNNAQFGRRLGLRADARFGQQDLGFIGAREDGGAWSVGELAGHVERALGHRVVQVGGEGRTLRRIAWCTGGAQGSFEAAIAAGADAYITGEISEPQAHYARECGVAFLACGHHASERYGAPAVAGHVATQCGLEHQFIDIENPA